MKITFPHLGNVYIAGKAFLEELGHEVITPPVCSKRTMELGSKYSPEMMCLPFKIFIGNYIESIEKGADTILITIGGNDLFRGGQTLMDYNPDSIGKIQSEFVRNLASIFTDIREANGKATIFFLGLYNPFIELEDGSETSKVVREWNRQSEETSAGYANIVFVPTFDIFQLQVNEYLYTDRFHPNKEGYRLISERVAPLIKWEEGQP